MQHGVPRQYSKKALETLASLCAILQSTSSPVPVLWLWYIMGVAQNNCSFRLPRKISAMHKRIDTQRVEMRMLRIVDHPNCCPSPFLRLLRIPQPNPGRSIFAAGENLAARDEEDFLDSRAPSSPRVWNVHIAFRGQCRLGESEFESHCWYLCSLLESFE